MLGVKATGLSPYLRTWSGYGGSIKMEKKNFNQLALGPWQKFRDFVTRSNCLPVTTIQGPIDYLLDWPMAIV